MGGKPSSSKRRRESELMWPRAQRPLLNFLGDPIRRLSFSGTCFAAWQALEPSRPCWQTLESVFVDRLYLGSVSIVMSRLLSVHA